MTVKVGAEYRHFKGMTCKVIALAKHSETLEDMVVYVHDNQSWVRPYSSFVSKVDKEKYPNVKQEYRFEEVDHNA